MKSKRYKSIDVAEHPHGTRSRYVAGRCRCDECKAANTRYYHDRMARRREQEASVSPSNRALQGFIVRGGKTYVVRLCPGANGQDCPFGDGKRGAWLRGKNAVCARCVERATVWNGLVQAKKAQRHLRKLSKLGVGYKSVGDACDVSKTVLMGIVSGEVNQIRAETEKRILAVDEGARAGGAIVDAARGNRIIRQLRQRGMTLTEIGRELGYVTNAPVQLGKAATMLLATRVKLERLLRKIEAAEEPNPRGRPTRNAEHERERPPPPDMIPGEWLDDDGAVLPHFREAAAKRRTLRA